jgi:hypothetical protein
MEREHNIHLYKVIRENGDWSAFEMVPLENYCCDTILEAKIREQYWIYKNKSNLNTRKAYSGFEIRDEYMKDYNKHYKEENKDSISEYNNIIKKI